MKKPFHIDIKHVFGFIALVIICIIVVLTVISKHGKILGRKYGNFVGSAIGSFEGGSKGYLDGSQAGKNDGISSADTTLDYATEISKIGRLDVLSVDLKAENVHTYGDHSKKDVPIDMCKYAVMRVYEGTGIFSIDLNKVVISKKDNVVEVEVPAIDVNIKVDEQKTRTVAEWRQSNFQFGESAESGFDAEGNTEKVIKEKLKEKLSSSVSLKEQAEKATGNQLTSLIKSMCGTDVEVQINILDEEINLLNMDGSSSEKRSAISSESEEQK